jgi:hypothetical protein
VKNEYFLIVLILALRIADAVTSYIPAKGLVQGIGEANPVISMAIERWGVFWTFVIFTAVSIAFVLAFVAATHLEEARRAGTVDYEGILRIRRFRIAGLMCLVILSVVPLFLNLAVALGLT